MRRVIRGRSLLLRRLERRIAEEYPYGGAAIIFQGGENWLVMVGSRSHLVDSLQGALQVLVNKGRGASAPVQKEA